MTEQENKSRKQTGALVDFEGKPLSAKPKNPEEIAFMRTLMGQISSEQDTTSPAKLELHPSFTEPVMNMMGTAEIKHCFNNQEQILKLPKRFFRLASEYVFKTLFHETVYIIMQVQNLNGTTTHYLIQEDDQGYKAKAMMPNSTLLQQQKIMSIEDLISLPTKRKR